MRTNSESEPRGAKRDFLLLKASIFRHVTCLESRGAGQHTAQQEHTTRRGSSRKRGTPGVAGLHTHWPFAFALDQGGTLWMTLFDDKRKPRQRLLKAAVFEASLARNIADSTEAECELATLPAPSRRRARNVNNYVTSRDSIREVEANTPLSTADEKRSRARGTHVRWNTMTSAFLAAIFLLGLCVANAINFTTVYEWDRFDFIWPSNGRSKQNFDPKKVYLQYMAVFGERLFLSLDTSLGIPASLVWLPTCGSTTVSPKLAPFPSWDLHKKDDCDTIQAAKGLEMDADGRLWVLDNGSSKCWSKLWIFDLINSDTTERIHQFPDTVVSPSFDKREVQDLVLEKTPDDYLAYIADSKYEHIVVYSRKTDKSCQLFSVSLSELKNEGGSAGVYYIGEWTEFYYRILSDSANVLYAAFYNQNYISKWNISEPFREQQFLEVGQRGATWSFTFALDTNGNLWITNRNETRGENKTRHQLLKAAVGARSYLFSPSTALTTSGKDSDVVESSQTQTIVIWLLVCCLVVCGIAIVLLALRMRRMQTSFRQIPKDNHELMPSSGEIPNYVGERSMNIFTAETDVRAGNLFQGQMRHRKNFRSNSTHREEEPREKHARSEFALLRYIWFLSALGRKMSPFLQLAAIFLLGLCLANAVNFTYVYEWSQFDFVWPSEADTSNEQMKQNFNPDYVEPHFMAVFGQRLFLSLDSYSGIPASLVWLPTSGMSTVRPKLAPFPSRHLHKKDNCDSIQWAYGLEVDTNGRLWVLDNGRGNCSRKLWIFNLLNNDRTERVHQFPETVVSDSEEDGYLSDIVLDKTPDDFLAYVTAIGSQHIVVYSRNMDKSWTVKTPGRKWQCLALSPNREGGELYLARDGTKELYSVSVSELKNEGGSATAKFIGKLTDFLYRMLLDSADVMYAAYYAKNYVFMWNISEPYREQRFHEVKRQGDSVPFTFALDTNGNLWITERYVTGIRNRHYKLLKAAVGTRSYQFSPSTALPTPPTFVKSTQMPESKTAATFPPALESNETCVGAADFSEDLLKSQSLNKILIWLFVCCFIGLVLSGAVIAWLTLRIRRMQYSLSQISKENRELLPSG
ncbi:Hypothetical predicted protein [Cloeon dipterum]|uniref:Bee-milk protein n=1 Tax=Cloeon dipterum TaxID=197152 RepID=A0A8S1DPA4_9INSE|nr:Hypothetical predicted protein [Cloeon dipterum]